jgi:hypothetical protein
MQLRIAIALACLVGAAWTLPVVAQVGGGPGRPAAGGPPRGGGMPERPGDERPAGPSLNELVAVRMSQLEEDLRLQPQQATAWGRFRDSVQRLLDDRRRAARTAPAEATAPQRLDAIADGARNRLAAVEDVVDAAKALYAQLSPEQRSVADRRLALPLATLAGTETRGDDRGGANRAPGAAGAMGAPPRP